MSRILFIPNPDKKILKKNSKKIQKIKKPLSGIIFSETGRDRLRKRKKILVPNSVHTQPGQENSEKNSKKIQKIKKPLSGIIFRQIIGRESEKKILSRIPFILDQG